ncbi:MAG: Rne/Rng family ribonuclease [Candidatus Omnitrophota bacterium]|nr:Rne/Rng family ribonuclease [Candidatus Omnitrophota bacterium]
MQKEIYINVTQHEKRVAVMENKRIEEFYIERPDSAKSLFGNIYKGKVESVLPGMGAAFVNIGLEKNGFLYVTDVVSDPLGYEKLLDGGPIEESHERGEPKKPLPSIGELLKKGDDVLVQVVKEPIGTKGPRLTTHVSIPGRFLVLMPFDNHIGLSRRIESREERDRIRKILEELKIAKDMGVIVRTAAQGASQKDFFREMRYLTNLWHNIKSRARKAKPPCLIHQEYDIILRVARDIFTNDVSKLDIDSRDEFKRISRFLKILAPHLRPRLRLHTDRIPLFEKHDIERQIEKIYNRIVQLKSGGYLIFDQTESLVAIDVNSGKFVGKRNLEDTAFKTNIEAAEEVPRQLKLRDLGGIIIIDFIDMEIPQHRKTIYKTLEKHLEGDKAKTKILNISSIGLIEMTRQRVRKSIESKSYQRCPYCSGRGIVKSISTVSIELLRKLERFLQDSRKREVFVSLHPEVAYNIAAPEKNMIRPLERRFRKTIRVIEDPNLHIEDIKIEEGKV